MTQRVPADARLGRTRTGQDIGYRVLNLNREPFRGFALATETAIPGNYVAVGGVEAPDTGGYIVWGTAVEDIAETTIEPATVDSAPALLARIEAALDALLARIAGLIPPQPPVIVNTAEFEAGIVTLRGELAGMIQDASQHQAERVAEIYRQIEANNAIVRQLDRLNDAVIEFDQLSAVSSHLNSILSAYPAAVRLSANGSATAEGGELSAGKFEVVARKMAALQAEIERQRGELAIVQETSQQAEAKRLRSIEAIDKFLVTVGGNGDE